MAACLPAGLQLAAKHLSSADVEWLVGIDLDRRSRDEADPVPEYSLFDDCGTAETEDAGALRAALSMLSPPRSPRELPEWLRAPWCFEIYQVGCISVPALVGSRTGHGDVVWGGARYASELLESHDGARRLLGSELAGKNVCELGAGIGLPSWVALRRGARVFVTDLPDPERIAALATSAALNTTESEMARVYGHKWGESCELLCEASGGFDLVLCCDCLYIVAAHGELVQSIKSCLAPTGVALIAYAYHKEFDMRQVDGFFDVARAANLEVTHFDEKQVESAVCVPCLEFEDVPAGSLTLGSAEQLPTRAGIPSWRFYVHVFVLQHAAGPNLSLPLGR